MASRKQQVTISGKEHLTTFRSLCDDFLSATRAAERADGTIRFYQFHCNLIIQWLERQGLPYLEDLTPSVITRYLLYLTEQGHNKGGKHGAYRTLRAVINHYVRAYEPVNFRNPIQRIKAPERSKQVLEPITQEQLKILIGSCQQGSFHGDRDAAIFATLMDTGVRASELVGTDIRDLQLNHGSLRIRHGKGEKARTVFVGTNCKKYLRRWLRHRDDAQPDDPLFTTTMDDRLTYWGLKNMLADRAERCKLEPKPSLHSFRRGFAIACLRNGMDVYSLQHLMGHADLQVLRQYLKQTDEDLYKAHLTASPLDKMK